MRRYFSILNFFDLFKTAWGTMGAMKSVFSIYPDVIFGKGGYVSFPTLVAARFFRIPAVIHESDSVPGRMNMWASKFARKIAISYPESSRFFPKDKTALTGTPIRKELFHVVKEGSHDFLQLSSVIPTILVLGGSQGAQIINENLLNALPELVKKYQIIHQAGSNNIKVVKETARVILEKNDNRDRYKLYESLDSLTLRMAVGACDLIISRAGSTIFEIAVWEKPVILIPITDSNGDHQRQNAYNYARAGAAEVIEENNLTSHILIAEIERLMNDPALRAKMAMAARSFAKTDAADLIAKELISIALEHEV
jgi:UDP-N-acetylglucosamine--N-acetylmuramyl-(pentapeptide) pyrophosphoryl-undecaprenol N-acetylglucosamine transferase